MYGPPSRPDTAGEPETVTLFEQSQPTVKRRAPLLGRYVRWAISVGLGILSLGGGPALPADPARTLWYTVVLDSPSVGQRLSQSRANPKGQRQGFRRAAATSDEFIARAVQRSQDSVVSAMEAEGAEILGSVQNVLNAVFVRATSRQAEAFRALGGVKSVVPARSFDLQINAVAESDILRLRAARLRPVDLNADGSGVKIAIIDSGLDFDHAAFKDDSLAQLAGYPRGRPEHLQFASNKIIAVRNYMHLQNSALPDTSAPDDLTPRDFSGHGTAVAMIAAGARVQIPGGGEVEGIAPKAYLGVYKVSGTPGIHPGPSSQAVIAAIDDAVTDGMDILNLSLGVPAQFPWHAAGTACEAADDSVGCDPLAVAAQSAVVDFGRVVVAAAGNTGSSGLQQFPTRNTISSPAIAPDVIAVGATVNARRFVQSVRVGLQSFAAMTGSGPGVDGALSAPATLAADLGHGFACDAFPDWSLRGRIAVIQRGGCWFVDKVEHAAEAGAVGVVIYNDQGSDELIEMASIEETDIPAYFVGASDGALLVAEVSSAAEDLTVTLDATLLPQPLDPAAVADFSARGPTPGLNLKPDIAAPGAFIYSAAADRPWRLAWFRPDGFHQSSGTSLAAPFVAGAAALVWQQHPNMTVREITSALVNNASQSVLEDGAPARVASVGGGLLDLERALDPIATVEPPTVGFGPVPATGLPVSADILVTNRSQEARSYTMTVAPKDADARAAVTVDGMSSTAFELGPDEFVRVRVALAGQLPVAGSYEGHLKLARRSDGSPLRVPFLYVAGDGQAHNAFALAGEDEYGLAGEPAVKRLLGKYVDRFGAPVASLPVSFAVREGDGTILESSTATDEFGLVHAQVQYAAASGLQSVVATAGGIEIPFWFEGNAQQPVIEEVINLARYESGYPVAPGSVVAVFGGGLSEFAGVAPSEPLPLALKAASVSLDFPEQGVSVPAPLFFASHRQLNIQIPWEFAGLNFAYLKARVRTRSGAQFVSEPVVVDLADVAPGILVSEDAAGGIVPELWHPDGYPVTREDPARPGDVVIALMTGNGPLETAVPTGRATADSVPTRHQPVVMVGGTEAAVDYSGSAPGMVGIYRVDFILPETLPSGELVLQVTVHGAASNIVKLPVL